MATEEWETERNSSSNWRLLISSSRNPSGLEVGNWGACLEAPPRSQPVGGLTSHK